MADLMTFPNTVEEFMEQYKIKDTEQIYTNGAELVPIFRMKQWFEHLPTADVVELEESKAYKCLSYTMTGMPTTDVRENVHAHWVKHKDRECWYCSHCNADDYYAYYWSDTGGLELQDRFCPNCGAQMDERSEDGEIGEIHQG